MSLIDRLLDLFGLQRKATPVENQIITTTPIQEEKVQEQEEKPESALEASWRKQREVSERITAATTDFVSTAFEGRAIAIERLTQMMRDGGTYDEKEFNRLVKIASLNLGDVASPELSDEIKQALREALEERGKEDQDEPEDDKNK
jgi:flagellar biosynthesis GTPase FlhF